MNKPHNWDNEQAVNVGEYETIEPGGYVCVIKKAEIAVTRTNKEMLVLSFDIHEGKYRGYFEKRYKADTRKDKRWGGVYRQLTCEESTKYFKGLIASIERSNSGYKFDFNEGSLTGKLFGVIFGREEYYSKQKGEYLFSVKPRFARDAEVIRSGKFDIPRDILADRGNQSDVAQPSAFTELRDDDGELPF